MYMDFTSKVAMPLAVMDDCRTTLKLRTVGLADTVAEF